MKILNSLFVDTVNSKLAALQERVQRFSNDSLIIKNLDNIIFFFILTVLFSSLFLPSEMIGLTACIVIGLTLIKFLLIKGQDIKLASCNLFILIFLGISFISVINSSLYFKSLYGFSKTLIYIGYYFSVIQYLRFNKDKILPIIYFIGALACFEGLVGIIQNNIGLANISTWQDTSYVNPEDVLSRVYGTLKPYNPNLLAGYLIAAFPCVLAFVFNNACSKKFKSSIISAVLAGITALTLFFTGCRGAYIALFTMFLAIVWGSWQIVYKNDTFGENCKRYWKYIVSGIAGIIAAGIFIVPGVLKRILSIFILRQDSSTSFRMNVYHSSIQMFQDNWLLGIGTGNKTFREIYGLYMMSGFDALSTYCVFLEIAVESGIFALIAYIAFLWILLSNSVKAFIVSKDTTFKIIVFTAAVSITAVMVHGCFDTIYFRPQVQFVFWMMAAILTVLLQDKEIAE